MYYKVIKDNRVIDVLDELVFLKYQKKHDRMIFCNEPDAQAIFSSDREHIWHVESLYDIPVARYDTVKLEEIDDWAFEENNLRENYVIADLPNLKRIGSGSFYGTNLLGISFSNLPNLETIGSYSFYGNSITSLEISNLPKLNLIDDDAFYENMR